MATDGITAVIDPKDLRLLVDATRVSVPRGAPRRRIREPSAVRGLVKLALLAVAVREVAVWLW